MERFNHVTNTWVLSIGFHTVLWAAWLLYLDGSVALGMVAFMIPAGFLFSAPAYLLCLWWIKYIVCLPWCATGRLALWLSAALFSIWVSLQVSFLFLLQEFNFRLETLCLIIPGTLGAVLSILIRYKQFFQLIRNATDNDNSMV